LFWAVFLFSALLSAARPDFAPKVVGDSFLETFDHMYAEPLTAERPDGRQRNDTLMAGFYIQHNTSIGLRCFAWGILLGLGSLYQLFENALIFGTLFGYMTTRPHGANFFEFVTAHSAFELTAIIVASAAGLRLGWGLVDTQGQSRLSSLRREAANALPGLGVAVVLFFLAALVEGFVSASALPYWAKAAVAILSAASIVTYLALGGRGEPAAGAARPR
jgi:uncharacterized membrane protein SpoIIM required for sporulation